MSPAAWDIALDRDGEVPVGVQLAWAVRGRILAGELPSGERLPGVRELATSAGVHVNTVRAVYARLEAEGLIASVHGSGTFVSDSVATDPRLADVTQRALADARAAGLDPRELAAAVYAGAGEAAPADHPQAGSTPAAERRALRAEIAALDRELADRRHVQALAAYPDSRPSPARSGRPRVLDAAELRAQRDELAAQVRLLREAAEVTPVEPAPAPRPAPASATSSTRSHRTPAVRWTLSFGA